MLLHLQRNTVVLLCNTNKQVSSRNNVVEYVIGYLFDCDLSVNMLRLKNITTTTGVIIIIGTG